MVNLKAKSIWKRYAFCGGMQIYGTLCSIDEETQVVSWPLNGEGPLNGTIFRGWAFDFLNYFEQKPGQKIKKPGK